MAHREAGLVAGKDIAVSGAFSRKRLNLFISLKEYTVFDGEMRLKVVVEAVTGFGA